MTSVASKLYVWGFPGIGKSSVSNPRIIDADCERFKYRFMSGEPDTLHQQTEWHNAVPDLKYPQNYLDHIRAVDADIVLVNCHISLLAELCTEEILMVYPAPSLKEEYLSRFVGRGDNDSFLVYMEESFEDILHAAKCSPYRKLVIRDSHVYLADLLEGDCKMNFITKETLSQHLDKGLQLGVFTPPEEYAGQSAEALAQLAFDGKVQVDLDGLLKKIEARQAELAKEQLYRERRGGLSHEELRDKIMQGIVNGALSIHHGQIAPYSYGYEVTFGDRRNYANRWECYCKFPEVAEKITVKIEQAQQNREVFSSVVPKPVDVPALLSAIEAKEKEKLASFIEESKSGLERRGYYSGHVAGLSDVHSGRALDGIILGHFHGDYSSMTTGSQNDLMRALVALKGFGLDCLSRLPDRDFIVSYLKAHGTDVSTPEKLNAWIRANPDKCALPENRARKASLSAQISSASNRSGKAPGAAKRGQEPTR